ncbi:hypothetical protein D3C77_494230 [compost metagenome]
MITAATASAIAQRPHARLGQRLFEQICRQAHFTLWAEFACLYATGADNFATGSGRGQLIFRAHIGQRPVQGAIEKVVNHAPVTKAHFMLGRVNVDVDARRVDLQEQHEGRMPAVEQDIAISLAYRVGHQLVAHGAAVDEKVLQIGLTAREGRQTHPAPQVQAVALDFDRQCLLKEA